jgi:regulator of RNase E activity RraB
MIGGEMESYSYVYGGGMRALISFDVAAAMERRHEGHPHGRRIIVFVDARGVRPDGLPADTAELIALEDDLTARLRQASIDCRFVGRMTYGGMRELVFQVEDAAGFDALVGGWIGAQRGRRIEVRPKDGWSFFDEKIRPTAAHWQQIQDRKVIAALLEAGSDPARPHPLEHTFKGPARGLDEIARQLGADGFREIRRSDDVLVLVRPSPLDLEMVSRLTGALAAFAEAVGVAYDGWGSPVVR